MYENETKLDRPNRRRIGVWAAFGLVGILMSAAWATGFSTTNTTTNATNAQAANVFGQSAVVPDTPSPYAGLITNPANVDVAFDGLWGQVTANAMVFKADLSAQTGTYYVDIYLRNALQTNKWSSAQIKWLQFDCTGGDPVAGDFTTAYAAAATSVVGDGNPKVMNITAQDAHVAFASLAGGNKYCFLVAATPTTAGTTHADDVAGTFLTRPDTSAAPDAPQFTGIVNRSA